MLVDDESVLMSNELQMASKNVEGLEADLKEMEKLRLELAEFFCEDEKTFKLDECIKTFGTFFERFQKAIQVGTSDPPLPPTSDNISSIVYLYPYLVELHGSF